MRASASRVDERCLAGDGNRFSDVAELQLDVDGRGELRAQFDAGALDRGEPRQGERDGIRTRTEINYAIESLRVGDDCAHLFNQGRTGRLDGDTWEHSAGSVTNDAFERTALLLGKRRHYERGDY